MSSCPLWWTSRSTTRGQTWRSASPSSARKRWLTRIAARCSLNARRRDSARLLPRYSTRPRERPMRSSRMCKDGRQTWRIGRMIGCSRVLCMCLCARATQTSTTRRHTRHHTTIARRRGLVRISTPMETQRCGRERLELTRTVSSRRGEIPRSSTSTWMATGRFCSFPRTMS
eukprot:COSAG06_NODE_697_length_12986_cov_4386.721269_8_plen_172_part_00